MRFVTEATSMGEAINSMPERMRQNYPDIVDDLFWDIYERCKNFSMLHIPGFLNLYQSIRYIHANQISGDFVECGCFLGGASIFMSMLRDHLGMSDKRVWLFDTFEGFPDGEQDALIANGQTMKAIRFVNFEPSVRQNFADVHPEGKNICYVKGDVTETIPNSNTGAIALLRLDTDFYQSTKAELQGLYPRLVRGGVLIVDDYGVFEGSRRATVEFFNILQSPPLLNRIDCAVWAGIKP